MNSCLRSCRWLVAVAVISAGGIAVAQQVPDSLIYTTGAFAWHEPVPCNPEGSPTSHDPELNRRKNRDKPPPAYAVMGVPTIMLLPSGDLYRKPRTEWSQLLRDTVKPHEDTGVALQGYLVRVKKETDESCNCDSTKDVDYHTWISATLAEAQNRDQSHAVVAEISPRTLFQHQQGWKLSTLEALANQHVRIRVRGWLMWDEEHPEQIGDKRGTLWEIHPIHKFEVYTSGHWTTL